jgi:hypothetical protein
MAPEPPWPNGAQLFELLGVRLGDHCAVPDEHHALDPEAL